VLATGELLLDDSPSSVARLEEVFSESEGTQLIIWYYRENAATDPPPIATEILKIITENRLPIRLSSRPDFSDVVIDVEKDLERVFASVRQKAAQGQLVVLRPDGRVLAVPALRKGPAEVLAGLEKMLPSNVKRNIAVIGETAWTLKGELNLPTANEAIPFLGLLLGFASLGHTVWVFDANVMSIISAGCREADVVIVDGQRCPTLPSRWQSVAQSTMRGKQILLHDRQTHQLRRA
jgi:hypothetical protein